MPGDIPQEMLPEIAPGSSAGFQRAVIQDCLLESISETLPGFITESISAIIPGTKPDALPQKSSN